MAAITEDQYFRHHVGTALIERDNWPDHIAGNWGGSNAPRHIKDAEVPLEQAISKHIRINAIHLA